MVRKSTFSGSWYPNNPENLQKLITESISEHKEHESNRFALLPHAGLTYAAQGIAPFFAASYPELEQVVLISPSHYVRLSADQMVSAPFTELETPFGPIPSTPLDGADEQWLSAIEAEHALEMVLPFIATLDPLPAVSLALLSSVRTPVTLRTLADGLIDSLGEERIATGRVAIIASSDFTHYGSRFDYTPYGSDGLEKAKEVDLAFATLLSRGKIDAAFTYFQTHQPTICGWAAALLVAEIARRFDATGQVYSYYTSADIAPASDGSFVAYATLLWS
ncbi:MAG TPA: AmmeMemoRadiSam system protein B [Sphaerochaeta sp.]|nr:AmmeMemoRadiSam system protein B [Sphaerochaeta sp.]